MSVILRPRAIVGPGDELLVPKLIKGMQERRLPIIGDQVLTDLTYIDNFIDAILAASFHLYKQDSRLKHAVYNISNGEPVLFTHLYELMSTNLNLPYPSRHISFHIALWLGWTIEIIWWYFVSWFTTKPPPLSRYIAKSIGGSITLDITRAKSDLGYFPRVPISEGLERIILHLKATATKSY